MKIEQEKLEIKKYEEILKLEEFDKENTKEKVCNIFENYLIRRQ